MNNDAKGRRGRVRDAPGEVTAGKAPPACDAHQLTQRDRFIQAAAELGCEENFAHFEEALPRIVKAPPQHQTTSKPKSR